MNKLMIIGNLTRDPERRTLQDGTPLCVFTVAVNRRKNGNGDKNYVDYFQVNAWNGTGDVCAKYLAKGKKVCVTGPVSVYAYTGQDGQARAILQVNAHEVEFLSGRSEEAQGFGGMLDRTDFVEPSPSPVRGTQEAMNLSSASDYMEVEPDDLPF